MPITPSGPAPYAPPGTVIAVVEHNRRVGLPTPVTTEVIARITGTPGLAPRVLKALRLYDLVDDNGQLTRQFDELARAPSEDDLKKRFAEVLQAAYGDVFEYLPDPDTATPERLEGLFRGYQPRGQLASMVGLFRGLCQYSGIMDPIPVDTPKPRATAPANRAAARVPAPRRLTGTEYKSTRIGHNDLPPRLRGTMPADAGDLHPFFVTLLEQLPELGSPWPRRDREAWTTFAASGFNLLYRPGPDDDSGPSLERRTEQ